MIGVRTVINGMNMTHMCCLTMDVMCTELGGIYFAVQIIEYIVFYYNILTGTVTMCSNYDSRLNILAKPIPLFFQKVSI